MFGSFRLFNRDSYDDFIDRMHYEGTSGLLVALAALVSFKQFGGKPVECMVPDTFTKAWEEFTEVYCWAKNTYWLPFSYVVPREERARSDLEISYYQWVPFFLLLEAACFQLPFLIWRLLATHSGIKIHEIVRLSTDPGNMEMRKKAEALGTVRIHLENALKFHWRLRRKHLMPHTVLRCFNLPYTSVYVASMYLSVKLLYLVNVSLQFFVLNRFLMTGTEYQWGGFGAIQDILQGHEWENSGYFPRVTLCDIKVRVMGNVQLNTMQCVLVINILNEKIFIFLWFWYQTVMFLTLSSLIYWFGILTVPYFSHRYIKRHLELADLPVSLNKENDYDVRRFGILTVPYFSHRYIKRHLELADLPVSLNKENDYDVRRFGILTVPYFSHRYIKRHLELADLPVSLNKENDYDVRRFGILTVPYFSHRYIKRHLELADLPVSLNKENDYDVRRFGILTVPYFSHRYIKRHLELADLPVSLNKENDYDVRRFGILTVPYFSHRYIKRHLELADLPVSLNKENDYDVRRFGILTVPYFSHRYIKRHLELADLPVSLNKENDYDVRRFGILTVPYFSHRYIKRHLELADLPVSLNKENDYDVRRFGILTVPYFSHRYIKRHLELADLPVSLNKENDYDVRRFGILTVPYFSHRYIKRHLELADLPVSLNKENDYDVRRFGILTVPYFSHRYIKRHLELADLPVSLNKENDYDVRRFISSYLHRDGVFVLRMVEMHAGIIFASDLTTALWDSFFGIEDIRVDMARSLAKKSHQDYTGDKKPLLDANPTIPRLTSCTEEPERLERMARFFYRRQMAMSPRPQTASLLSELRHGTDSLTAFAWPNRVARFSAPSAPAAPSATQPAAQPLSVRVTPPLPPTKEHRHLE